jgi:hypothetical protein
MKKLFKKIVEHIKRVINVIKKVVKFIKENLRVIVAVVAAVAIVAFTGGAATLLAASLLGTTTAATSAVILGGAITGAIAGGLSGLILTGSLSGALKGAALGFVGGAIGGAVTATGAGQGVANALKLGRHATSVGQGINAGLSGGIMGKITGGSFSKGFKNAVIAFGAFKGLDTVNGGAITKAGKWLGAKGRKFFGTDSRLLLQDPDEARFKKREDYTDAERLELVKNQRLAKDMIWEDTLQKMEAGESLVIRGKTIDATAKAFGKSYVGITEATGVEVGGDDPST